MINRISTITESKKQTKNNISKLKIKKMTFLLGSKNKINQELLQSILIRTNVKLFHIQQLNL